MLVYAFLEQNRAYPALHIQYTDEKLKSVLVPQGREGKGLSLGLGYVSRKSRKCYCS